MRCVICGGDEWEHVRTSIGSLCTACAETRIEELEAALARANQGWDNANVGWYEAIKMNAHSLDLLAQAQAAQPPQDDAEIKWRIAEVLADNIIYTDKPEAELLRLYAIEAQFAEEKSRREVAEIAAEQNERAYEDAQAALKRYAPSDGDPRSTDELLAVALQPDAALKRSQFGFFIFQWKLGGLVRSATNMDIRAALLAALKERGDVALL